MSAVVQLTSPRDRALASPRIALLGTGTVGSAFVARCHSLRERGFDVPEFAWLSNSRALLDCRDDVRGALERARATPGDAPSTSPWQHAVPLAVGDVVVDATGSDRVAAQHADWLTAGIHVVTANKLGNGGDTARAERISDAQRRCGACYGDAATVGAGLPLLRTLRELVAGGDRIHAIEGVLSGSLAWLLSRYDDTRPFSDLVREARAAGYTEPDPRLDLSGEDVRRKLLILARAAGLPLDAGTVAVESLVPAALAEADDSDAALPALDAPLQARFRAAHRDGARLAFVGRVDAAGARVGLQALPLDHPLAGGSGTDNRVAISSDRYRHQPLVIQGAGAGAEVTAAALLDDVLRVVRSTT